MLNSMIHAALTVEELLAKKGQEIWSISSRATVYEALEKMAEKDVGVLVVIDDGRLVGIFSERDYARKVILKGKASKDTSVGELMTTTIFSVTPENTLRESLTLMTARQIRHLPVLKQGQLVGVITLGDVVRMIISKQENAINLLEEYVSGSA
ncbi:MAG: CBS domain-containing protein [bacterium]